MARSIKGASWDAIFLSGAKILTLLFGIVLSKIMSVGLSLQAYGTYAQANLITSVGTSLILLGLGDALNYYFNNRQQDLSEEMRSRIVNTVFFLETVVGVILAIAIYIGQNAVVNYFSNEALRMLLPFVSVLPLLGNLMYFYQILYVSTGKAKIMSLYNLVIMIIKIVVAYIAVYVLNNLIWIYLVLVLLDLGQMLVFKLYLQKNNVRIRTFKISKAHIGKILGYGLPMGVYALTSSLSRDLDKLVIGRLEGTETLAIYTNCSKILPFDVLVVSFATVLIPYIIRYVTEGNKDQSVRLFSSYMKVGYYSVWILTAAVLITPETIISFLYSDAYVAGKSIFVIYIFDSMLRFASMHLILTAANKTKTLMGYSLLSLGLNMVLNFLLYYLLGTIGPAVATLITALLYTWLILHKTIRIIDTRWRDVFNVKEVLWLLSTLVLGWFVAVMVNKGLLYLDLNSYLAMIISMALFGCGMLAVHFKKISAVIKQINTFKL